MRTEKNKSAKTVVAICLAVVVLLIVGIVGLFVYQTWQNGWQIDNSTLAKFGIVFAGLVLTMIKLISKVGNSRTRRQYEALYKQQIGNAFSAPGKGGARRALIKGISKYNNDEYDKAIALIKPLTKQCQTKADHEATLLFLAICYKDAGMLDDSIAVYEDLLKISPEYSRAWSNLGMIYNIKGQVTRAIECLEKAVHYDENNPYAWNNLAQAYASSSQWQKVISPAKRCLSIKSNMYQADSALMLAYFFLGEREKCKQSFDNAVLHGADAEALKRALTNLSQGATTVGDTSGMREEVIRAVGHVQRDSAIPMAEIRVPAPEDGNRSRLGGAPIDTNVPKDSYGIPMKLMAAIWCSEVVGVPDFPTEGVLRFYVSDNDTYGADFDNPTVQKDFRVLYDEDESRFDGTIANDPSISPAFPISRALPIRFVPLMASIRSTDYRFEERFNAALTRAGASYNMGELTDEESDFVFDQNSWAGHRIGGYPCFEQYDPRDTEPELQKYDTLLLQIVSHTADKDSDEGDLIMFGDLGGCQFFIPKDKLRARDFSDILYTWDCG